MNMPAAPNQLLLEMSEKESHLSSYTWMPLGLGNRILEWINADPFPHLVIDNFFRPEVAYSLARSVPEFDSKTWYVYENKIERKRTLNSWDRFPEAIYRVLWELCSPSFVSQMEALTGCRLFPDVGLHGGGVHSHTRGGNLNVHLDYSLHPKLGLERRVNLIVYLTENWDPQWGGNLELWTHDSINEKPGILRKSIPPLFNRAVLFDTTMNSWHGLPSPLECPEGICRNSLAMYYLCEPRAKTSDRGRALFAPQKAQENDPEVIDLIRRRSSVNLSKDVYRV